jgi:multicomponent Na+:H+ antiporter subunit E
MSVDNFQSSYKRMLVLLLLLAIAWLLWSGLFKPLLLGLGLFSCLLTFLVVRRMGYFDNQMFALRFNFRLFAYWAWLGREIFRSSIQVARVVLDPALPINPRTIEIESSSAHLFDQVTLANSITLTPGTLALDLHEGIIKVHTLTEDGARDLMSGEMDRRVNGLRDG